MADWRSFLVELLLAGLVLLVTAGNWFKTSSKWIDFLNVGQLIVAHAWKQICTVEHVVSIVWARIWTWISRPTFVHILDKIIVVNAAAIYRRWQLITQQLLTIWNTLLVNSFLPRSWIWTTLLQFFLDWIGVLRDFVVTKWTFLRGHAETSSWHNLYISIFRVLKQLGAEETVDFHVLALKLLIITILLINLL